MRTVGILLAAGSGQRFGQDKRLYRLPSGNTLLMDSLRKLETAVDHVAVVLRPDDERLAAELSGPRVGCCIAPRPANGMGSSLACAVRFVVDADAWLMMPTDFPLLRERTIRQLRASLEDGRAVVPICDGMRGHPVALPRQFGNVFTALDGEAGGRTLLKQNPERVRWLNVDDPGIYRDLDSLNELRPMLRDYPATAALI